MAEQGTWNPMRQDYEQPAPPLVDAQRCVKCGHAAADHADGILGASIWTDATGEQPLCHTDDHSCYVGYHARTAEPLTEGDLALYLGKGERRNRGSGSGLG